MAMHSSLGGYAFKTTAFAHQYEDLKDSYAKKAYAFFWEQGTGKTKEIIDTAGMLFEGHEIDGVFNLAPQGVHRNFIRQALPVHMPDRIRDVSKEFVYSSDKANRRDFKEELERFMRSDAPLAVLSMSYDGLITSHGAAVAKKFMETRRCLYAADETSRIKTEGAKRTKWVLASAKYAPYRRITNGTPVDNAPWDYRTQIQFLQSDFWVQHGMDSLKAMQAVFQNRHLESMQVGGKVRRFWVGEKDERGIPVYKNLDRLKKIIKPISSRRLKEDVLDLPPKLYGRFEFDITEEQRKAYSALHQESFVLLGDDQLATAAIALTLMLRCQQIACGFLPTIVPNDLDEFDSDGPDVKPETVMYRFEENPRIDALREVTEDMTTKAIVWARFKEDINQITAMFTEAGKTFVRYDGTCSEDERAANEDRFQKGDAQFFVGNPQVGGEGLTLTSARTVIYYSNSFKLRERLQSEDRAHRIGQTFPVNYIDLVAAHTIDVRLVESLIAKFDMATQCTGDRIREWLSGG